MSRVTRLSQAVQAFVLASTLFVAPILCKANTATLRADELFHREQWRDTQQHQEVYEGDVVILSDGQRLVGRLNRIPALHYSFGSVEFEPDEVASVSFGRVQGFPKMQVITWEGYNFIGQMPEEQLQFDQDIVDQATGGYSNQKRSLDPYGVNYIVLEPGQESHASQEKFFHVSLKNGDKVSVVLGHEPIHLTDGWRDQEIPADSLARVRFNGGLHGYYEGAEGDEPLRFAFVKDSHLNMRLAKDRNLLRMPWTQIESVRVDLGDFRPDIHQISWVNQQARSRHQEEVFVAEPQESETDLVAVVNSLDTPVKQQVNDSVFADVDQMMYIPAGSYVVIVEGDKAKNLLPTQGQSSVHVDMPAFYTDKHPVNNQQYAAFVAATGHTAPPHWIEGRIPSDLENDPVVNVSYQDAADYAQWLGRRLPSELEWQRAAIEANAIVVEAQAHRKALQNDQALSLLSFLARIEPAQAAESVDQVPFTRSQHEIAGSVTEWTSSEVNGASAGALNQMKALYQTQSRCADHKVVRTGFVGETDNSHPFPPRWRLHQNDRNMHTGFRTVCTADH